MNLETAADKLKAKLPMEKLLKLKELMFGSEQKFKDVKLNDGKTIVRYEGDALEVGMIVSIVDESGVLPLPKGDYAFEDGTTFTIVDDMGTADNVVAATDPNAAPEGDTPEAAAQAPAIPAAPKRVIKSQVEEQVFKIEIEGFEPHEVDLSPMFKKVNDENEALKKELEKSREINKELFALVEKIADEPGALPTEATPASKPKKMTREELSKKFKDSLK